MYGLKRGHLPAPASAVAAIVALAAWTGTARAVPSLEIAAYGEMLYSHYNYGPDQKSDPHGSPPDSRAIVDVPRFVLEFESYLTGSLSIEAEIEYEHGGTGSAMEIEYEEFGEFESEVEKGGEVELEEFYATQNIKPWFNARIGHMIVPVGLINAAHHPDDFFGTVRPEAEVGIIPTTWHETGVAAFGTVHGFKYQAQLINGLDSSGFGSQYWIVGGHQKKFEQVNATNMAVAGRLDYTRDASVLGVSGYYGNTSDNRPKPDMEGIPGHVGIGDVHAVVAAGPFLARGVFLYGTIENADVISHRNGQLPQAVHAPRTPVASAAMCYYAEAGYDVLSFLKHGSSRKLYPFARYEYYNSMQKVDTGVFADPRFERHVVAAGLNLMLTPRAVLKADYSHRTFGDGNLNAEDTFSIAFGFSGTLFEQEREQQPVTPSNLYPGESHDDDDH